MYWTAQRPATKALTYSLTLTHERWTLCTSIVWMEIVRTCASVFVCADVKRTETVIEKRMVVATQDMKRQNRCAVSFMAVVVVVSFHGNTSMVHFSLKFSISFGLFRFGLMSKIKCFLTFDFPCANDKLSDTYDVTYQMTVALIDVDAFMFEAEWVNWMLSWV